MTSASNQKYIDKLILALRMRNVPGDKIGQVVAEMEAHLADSGEDPLDAFGRPREYAKAWAADGEQPADWPKRTRYMLGVAGSGGGGALAGIGVIRTFTGETLWGLHGIVTLLAGVILMVGSAFVLPNERKIVDPRTGREPERIRRMGRRGMIISGSAVLLLLVFAVIVSITVD